MSEPLRSWISARVSASRIRAAITQEQLAGQVERSVEAISNIERGVSLPTLETLDRIAHALSIPIAFFLEDLSVERTLPRNAAVTAEISLILSDLSSRDADLLLKMAKAMADERIN